MIFSELVLGLITQMTLVQQEAQALAQVTRSHSHVLTLMTQHAMEYHLESQTQHLSHPPQYLQHPQCTQ